MSMSAGVCPPISSVLGRSLSAKRGGDLRLRLVTAATAVTAALLMVFLLARVVTMLDPGRTRTLHHSLAPHQGLSSLPLAAQGVVSATLGGALPAYHVGILG